MGDRVVRELEEEDVDTSGVRRVPGARSISSAVIVDGRGAGDVLGRILEEGLEHHLRFAYGDLRPEFEGVAETLRLRVLELSWEFGAL